MSDKVPIPVSDTAKSVSARLASTEEQLIASDRKIPTQLVANALIKAGYVSLDAQAKALGVSRSTAWTIVKAKQKLGCLNNKTVRNILANPDTPASVRETVRTLMDQENHARKF